MKLKKPVRECNYINASKIPLAKLNRDQSISVADYIKTKNQPASTMFIVSQGPIANTVVHHLQLIHEQKIDIVVMLTKLEETNRRGT